MSNVSNDNENFSKKRSRRKSKNIHKQIWNKYFITDTLRALFLYNDEKNVKHLEHVNTKIIKINKKYDYSQNLNTIFLSIYNEVFDLFTQFFERLKQNSKNHEAWTNWKKHKQSFNDFNVNNNFLNSWNLPINYTKKIIKISNKTVIHLNNDKASSNSSNKNKYESKQKRSKK